MALADTKKEDVVPLLAVLGVLGVLPLTLGALLFALGIRTLNRRFHHDRAMALAQARLAAAGWPPP